MKRLTVAVVVAVMMAVGAMPALAQESPVDEVMPIVIERPPTRVAVPPAVSPGSVAQQPTAVGARPGSVAQQPTAVRAVGAGQLAQTGIDTATAAGMAVLLLMLGAAVLAGARRKRHQVLA